MKMLKEIGRASPTEGGGERTEVLHALGEQCLEGVQTVALGVHTLGEGVSQVHLVLEEEAAGGRTRRGRVVDARLLMLMLVLVLLVLLMLMLVG